MTKGAFNTLAATLQETENAYNAADLASIKAPADSEAKMRNAAEMRRLGNVGDAMRAALVCIKPETPSDAARLCGLLFTVADILDGSIQPEYEAEYRNLRQGITTLAEYLVSALPANERKRCVVGFKSNLACLPAEYFPAGTHD